MMINNNRKDRAVEVRRSMTIVPYIKQFCPTNQVRFFNLTCGLLLYISLENSQSTRATEVQETSVLLACANINYM